MGMRTIPTIDPRSGKADGCVDCFDTAAIAAQVQAARRAQNDWAQLPLDARIDAMGALSAALAAHEEAILAALDRDTGRRAVSKIEISGVAGMIARWQARAAGIMSDLAGRGDIGALPQLRYETRLQPYPLVGAISPWNFPLLLSMIDAIPALLAGSAVIVKPSEVTSRFVAPLRRAIADIPQLDGVLRFITGDGAAGAALVDHVDMICFTGSVASGRKVAAAAAARMIPASLELGGKDPAIVLEGADLDQAATALLRGSITNSGQACQSIERIYAARPIFKPLVDRLVARAEEITLLTPGTDGGHLGPFIMGHQAEIVAAQITEAVAHGATVRCGGELEGRGGKWMRPTVLTDVNHQMTIMREETFGPVLPVMAFDTVDEALALANDSAYGLSGAVFAGSIAEAQAVAARMEVGAVSINEAALTAFVSEAEKTSCKLSGIGPSRMGDSGLSRFLRKQAHLINQGPVMPLDILREG